MGMFDEVKCNSDLFGVHKGETHQTKDLHWLGGLLDNYEITPSGRLEFLEYTVEVRSDPTLEGIARWCGSMTRVFTGGRRDLKYHGWLYLSCFGRAKFTDGTMVAFEPEPERPIESEDPDDEVGKATQNGEERGEFESDPNREFRAPIRSAIIGKRFRSAELPGLYELEAFVNEISPAVRSKLAWQINRSLGLDTNAIRQLLKDKSNAEEWLRFEQESE
jgi:hypothetical protein